ncbi:MAG: class IV adenylate cyclase [Patescibacteria group bacterium]
MEEIEVKFLNINPVEIENKLKSIGAQKVGEWLYRRRVFDYPDLRLAAEHSWLRLRDEGDKITLAFKRRLGVQTSDGTTSDTGMEEMEIVVSDFEQTGALLEAIGLKEKFYEENRRVRFMKNEVEFDIDTWPKLPPYLEIEGKLWEQVNAASLSLGLKSEDGKRFSTHQVYKLNGIEEHDYQKITFTEMVKKVL